MIVKTKGVNPLTLGERIKKVRRALDLTQREFGERISIKQNSVAQIEMGRNTSDQTIFSICREFSVSETWLRTGEGEMFLQLSRDEEIAAYLGQIMSDDEDSFRRRMISVLCRLNTEEWAMLERMAQKLLEETKKPTPKGRPDSKALNFEIEGKLVNQP